MVRRLEPTRMLAPALSWSALLLTSGLPLAWMIATLASHPATLVEAIPDRFRLLLLLKTLALSAGVAGLATLLALPVLLALGRGRSRAARWLWFAVPVPLLLPSLVSSYGWTQFLWLIDALPEASSPADHARCVLALASWLFPVVAVLGGVSLRRLDPALQEQARLDGAGTGVTLRMLLPTLLAGAAIVLLVASQEFAAWEPSGISVIATEVRMVFDTGAFSSVGNPITAPFADGSTAPATDQASRSAAAVSVALPLLLVTATIAWPVVRWVRRAAGDEMPSVGRWPETLDASPLAVALAWVVLLSMAATPIVGMILSLRQPPRPWIVVREYWPQLLGSLLLSAGALLLASALAVLTTVTRSRGVVVVGVACFLVGGPLLAIALVRLYNRPWFGMDDWLYDSPASAVLGHAARFGWIALAAGVATHGGGWRWLREQAAIDGAGPWRAALGVVLPIAWPTLLSAGMVVAALSLTEVPVALMLAPHTLVPLLMTWVHMLRFEPMIEASLLMVLLVVVIAASIMVLARLALRKRGGGTVVMPLILLGVLVGGVGCSERDRPETIWGQGGRGPGEFVYPRGVAYSETTDTYFVVDRSGRVQHLDAKGSFIRGWQMPRFDRGKPVGLTVGPDGLLWVPDTHYSRVVVFNASGDVVREFGAFGEAPGQFILPTDIAFDRAGRVYVAEYGGNDRVQVFDPQGNVLRVIGRSGRREDELARPQSILIVGDELFIADSCNHRISVWSLDGRHLRNLGRVGSGPGEFRFPYGLDVDREGKLVVCEFGNNRVQRIDPANGAPLGTWGRPGRGPGELVTPWAVAVDHVGRVVAVDGGNNRLQVFRF